MNDNGLKRAAYEYSTLVIKNAKFRGRIEGIVGTLGGLWLIGRWQKRKEARQKEMEVDEA